MVAGVCFSHLEGIKAARPAPTGFLLVPVECPLPARFRAARRLPHSPGLGGAHKARQLELKIYAKQLLTDCKGVQLCAECSLEAGGRAGSAGAARGEEANSRHLVRGRRLGLNPGCSPAGDLGYRAPAARAWGRGRPPAPPRPQPPAGPACRRTHGWRGRAGRSLPFPPPPAPSPPSPSVYPFNRSAGRRNAPGVPGGWGRVAAAVLLPSRPPCGGGEGAREAQTPPLPACQGMPPPGPQGCSVE